MIVGVKSRPVGGCNLGGTEAVPHDQGFAVKENRNEITTSLNWCCFVPSHRAEQSDGEMAFVSVGTGQEKHQGGNKARVTLRCSNGEGVHKTRAASARQSSNSSGKKRDKGRVCQIKHWLLHMRPDASPLVLWNQLGTQSGRTSRRNG